MKSIAFNLGCDFSDEHTLAIRKLVECTSLENSRYIGSVYGSPGGIVNPFGSTRPLKRETRISKKTFETNVKMLTGLGLKINFAFNSLFPHKRVTTNKGYDKNVFDSDFCVCYQYFELYQINFWKLSARDCQDNIFF